MYEAFYGLKERPFNLTPDPKYLYLSEKHKEAFAHLLFGIKNRSGFVMISGEIGTGKTTLCRNLLNQLDASTEVAFIFNPFLNPVELMKKINQEFGIDSHVNHILGLTEELNVHLLNSAAHGKNCVLVIDEAQNLAPQVLEQIRLLSNLETDTEKLLQIILIGQPELAEKLTLHELRQLNQRITARYHLKPLNALETLQYVAYRIHVAGGRKRLNFTKGAVRAVYRRSGGVPRMINALCDRALLIGYTKEQHVITAGVVRQAARELRGEKVRAPQRSRVSWRRWLPTPSIVVLAVVILALAHYLSTPINRFANELNVFNRILTGGQPPPAADPTAGIQYTATVDAMGAEVEGESTETLTESQTKALSLVMERLNAVGSTRPSQSLAPLLAEIDVQESLHAGLDALTSLWNLSLGTAYPSTVSVQTLTDYFTVNGLSCELLQPTLPQMAAINRPGLARITAGEKDVWVGVTRLEKESITIITAVNRRITVPQSEFAIYYKREYLAPWKDPNPDASVLTPGQRSESVRAFKQILRQLGRIADENTSDIYDKETESAVIAIQTETGLTADGKAGRQVRFAVTSWMSDAPTLRRSIGTTISAALFTPEMLPGTTARSRLPEKRTAEAMAEIAEPQKVARIPSDTAYAAINEDASSHSSIPENNPISPLSPAASPVQELLRAHETDFSNVGNSIQEKRQQTATEGVQPFIEAVDKRPNASSSGTMVEVRELPSPFHDAPLVPAHAGDDNSRTAPVWGSVPLMPRAEERP